MNDPSWPAVAQLAIQVVMSLGLAWIGYLTLKAKTQGEKNHDAIGTVSKAVNGRIDQMVQTATAAGHAQGVLAGTEREAARARDEIYARGLLAGAELEAAAAASRAANASTAAAHAAGSPDYVAGMRAAETLAAARTAAVLDVLRRSLPALMSKSPDEVADAISRLSATPPMGPSA